MFTEINKDSYSAKLWIASGKNISELENWIQQVAQEQLISSIKPSKDQINTWKASSNGKILFHNHVISIIGKQLEIVTLDALWRYFTGRTINSRNRKIVIQFKDTLKQNFCAYCMGDKGPFHLDHIIPLALGGRDTEENFQLLCAKCNITKGKHLDRFKKFI